MEKIKLLGNRIFVVKVEKPPTAVGKIVTPDNNISAFGDVIAVGDGTLADGSRNSELPVKVGQRVLYYPSRGAELYIDDHMVEVVAREHILAVME